MKYLSNKSRIKAPEFISNKIRSRIIREKDSGRVREITGFTLIEAIIYIALISIMLGFTVLTISQMMDAQSRLKSKIEIDVETDFVLRKMNWALTNALAINQPLINSSSSVLSIDKNGGSENPLVFDLASGSIRLSRGGGAANVLNNQYVTINQLSFEHFAASGTIPEALRTTIVIQSSSDSKTIQTINYLKK